MRLVVRDRYVNDYSTSLGERERDRVSYYDDGTVLALT